MVIDGDLLWQAYPTGFLARRGVCTVGGWQCVETEVITVQQPDGSKPRLTSRWLHPELGLVYSGDLPDEFGNGDASDEFIRWVNDGDLLPNVDPTDEATWAALKRDLAIATLAARNRGAVFADTDLYSVVWQRVWTFSDPSRRYGTGSWKWQIRAWRCQQSTEYGGLNKTTSGWPLDVYKEEGIYPIDTTDPALALIRARVLAHTPDRERCVGLR